MPEGVTKVITVVESVLGILEAINTILTVIEAVQAATAFIPFHAGGIVHAAGGYAVPGARNGGRDTVPAILSPGELVLNAAQQNNLATALGASSNIANGQLSTRIKGGDILIALDNTNRSKGGSRGTYARTK